MVHEKTMLEHHSGELVKEIRDNEEKERHMMQEIERMDQHIRCAQDSLLLVQGDLLENRRRAEEESERARCAQEKECRRIAEEQEMVDAQNLADRMRLLQAISDLETALALETERIEDMAELHTREVSAVKSECAAAAAATAKAHAAKVGDDLATIQSLQMESCRWRTIAEERSVELERCKAELSSAVASANGKDKDHADEIARLQERIHNLVDVAETSETQTAVINELRATTACLEKERVQDRERAAALCVAMEEAERICQEVVILLGQAQDVAAKHAGDETHDTALKRKDAEISDLLEQFDDSQSKVRRLGVSCVVSGYDFFALRKSDIWEVKCTRAAYFYEGGARQGQTQAFRSG